jgi:phosphate-selective porin OprO/OprP
MLAGLAISVGAQQAWAQGAAGFYPPADPSAGPGVQATLTSSEMAGPGADLAQQVADLKASLKKINDAANAAKAKAASQPSVNVGGMIQLDTAMFTENALANTYLKSTNGTEFRRVRLWAYGDAFQDMDYKVEIEFARTDRPTMKDVFFTVKELPYLENIRIGHMKEPFGLEQLTSDRFITFMERSMGDGDNGFMVPGRDIGVMDFGWSDDEKFNWASGVFLNTPQLENPPMFPTPSGNLPTVPTFGGLAATPETLATHNGAQTALTGRVCYDPWYDEASGGRGLLHFGAAWSYRSDQGYTTKVAGGGGGAPVLDGAILSEYGVKPEAHLGPTILGPTFPINAVDNKLGGLETAYEYGPFSVQAEAYIDQIDRGAAITTAQVGSKDGYTFSGCYVTLSYFLTGENRTYNRHGAYFDRVKPFTNFFRVRTDDCDIETGWGAWEIAYRWDYVDMYDGAGAHTPTLANNGFSTIGWGRANAQTIGLNWYLNPYSRIMANYVLAVCDRVDNTGTSTAPVATFIKDHTINAFEMRAAFDF